MARTGIEEAINAIYRAALEPAHWPDALERIADYVGGTGAMIVHNDLRNDRGSITVGRLREDLSDLYVERHCANVLVRGVAERSPLGQAVLGRSIVDAAEMRRTEFHADILGPQAIADQVLIRHGTLSPEGSAGGFGVTLDSRQAEDGTGVVERLTHLGPHLSRAFDLSLEIARQQAETTRIGTLLDLMPAAAILLDRSGRMTRTNAAAEAMLTRGDGLVFAPGGTLGASVADDNRRLRKAIVGALAFGAGDAEESFEQALLLRRGSGLPALLTILTPLPPSSFRFADVGEDRSALLVRIVDPAQEFTGCEAPLRQAYGLTNAETRVALLIASGLAVPALAAKLGISSNTVRTHLARVYDKTSTHSQVALAALLSAIGPAILPR